jgi:phosphonate transport system substrate-binding protein
MIQLGLATVTVLFTLMLLGCGQEQRAQDDCLRGDLDSRYCDRNGDLVADSPVDAGDWVDPDSISFSYNIRLRRDKDSARYQEAWSEFLSHMERVTGKTVRLLLVENNATQINAMRMGRHHVAAFNTGSTPWAVNCAGAVPFALMADKDGNFGYEMEIITYPGSGIEKVEDIKDKTLAFTSPNSNSGFKAPSAILKSKFGMVAEKDFTPAFSGKHDISILGVANKDYPAATIANSVRHRMLARGVIKEDQLKVIYTSQSFPTIGFGYAYNLAPELQKNIEKSFFSFNWDGSSLEKVFSRSNEVRFIPITFEEHWAIIREIDAANNISYVCR